MAANEKNAYTCGACGRAMVTVDLEDGTTPMFLNCDQCGGRASSLFYRVSPDLTPSYAWKKPTPADILKYPARVRSAMIDHVRMGGLCLYRIGNTDDDLTLVVR